LFDVLLLNETCARWNDGMNYKLLVILLVTPFIWMWSNAIYSQPSYLLEAKLYVEKITKPKPSWNGPTTGPVSQKTKTIVYVSADQRNGGAAGVGKAVEEAAKIIGWKFRLIDGQGTIAGRTAALIQASNLEPDGIVLGTVDGFEQAKTIQIIAKKNIVIVGWHSLDKPGPALEHGIFTNIATDPIDVATAAGMYVVAESNGKAGVVIFNDPIYSIGNAKANAMADTIKKCKQCNVLFSDDTHLKDTPFRMSQRTAFLLNRFGEKWTHSLATNDLYFDYMPPSLIAAAIPGNGSPKNVSAGDGSISAYERIRTNHYQIGTVAEPLRVHGWQAIDELNRAFAGEKASGYSTPVHLITVENIQFDGGPRNEYDPDNGYRDIYKKIWGIK